MSGVVLHTGIYKKAESGKGGFFSYYGRKKIVSDLCSFIQKGCEVVEVSFADFSGPKIPETLKLLDILEEFSPDLFFVINCREIPDSNKILKKISGIFSCLVFEIPENNPEKIVDRGKIKKQVLKLDEYGITFSFKCSSFSGLKPGQGDFLNFLFGLRPNSLELSTDTGNGIKLAFDVDFFYNEGRAVSWFGILISFLKMTPLDFFTGFDFFLGKHGFNFIPENHIEIEKIQLLFISELIRKRKLETYLPCIENLILLNGAYSRAYGEGEETILWLDWNPQDIFGEDITNIKRFCAEVCREKGRYRVYNREGEVVIEPTG